MLQTLQNTKLSRSVRFGQFAWALALVALFVITSRLDAQALYGTLAGTVTDSTGAVIPNATVKAVSNGTGVALSAATNGDGTYSINNLLPGSYDVTISANGFSTFRQKAVPVTVNSTERIDATLAVGSTEESVTVSAGDLPLLQTDKAEVAYNVSAQQVSQLPTSSTAGRNIGAFYQLVPGSTPPVENNSMAANPQRSMTANVNGLNGTANTTRIDGAIDTYPWLPLDGAAYVPPQDAVESVNVVTGSFTADQGSAGGAAMNIVIKSGTNHFHGSAYEYNGNQHFNARTYFNTSRVQPQLPKNIFNQFGYSVGGPIRKDKLFFFVNEEFTRIRKTNSGFATVGTAGMRQGDFCGTGTTIYDPSSATVTTGPNAGSGKTPFPNQCAIPVSPAAATLMALKYPLPNTNLGAVIPASNYFGSSVFAVNRNDIDAKVNYIASTSTTLFGHYGTLPYSLSDPQQFGGIQGGTWDGGQAGVAHGKLQNAGAGLTHVFTERLLIDANAGYTRQNAGAQSPDLDLGDYGANVLKIPGTNGGGFLNGGIPYMNFTNNAFTGLGNAVAGSPFLFRDNQVTGNANVTYIHGPHTLRFGGEYFHGAINHFQPPVVAGHGRFTFNGGATAQFGSTANAVNEFADFLLGDPQTIEKGVQLEIPSTLRYSQFAFYGQDTYQVRKDLTLTYGMRYEYYPLPVGDHFGVLNYNPAVPATITDANGTHSVGTVLVGGYGGVPQDAGVANGRGMIVPRLGVSYRFRQDTVIRGGFGITVDPDNLRNQLSDYPMGISLTQNGPSTYYPGGSFATGIPAFPVPDITSGHVPLPSNVSTNALPQTFRRGYIESWNLAVQRKLPALFVANVAYVGTHAVRQQTSVNINTAPPGGGVAGQALNAQYGLNFNNTAIAEQLPWMGSKYNALQAQLTRNSTAHGSTGLIYTFGKSENASDNSTNNSPIFGYPTFWNRNWALAGYDRKHNFEWWSVEPLPFGKGQMFLQHGLAGVIFGGWQLQAILSYYSGTAFTITASGSSLNAPGNTQVADQIVPHVEILGGHGPGQPYFNTADFAQPTGARFGTVGRNSVRGPGTFNVNAGLKRTVQLSERFALQFQGEAFDLTNTPQFANPSGTNVSAGGFGIITSVQPNSNRTLRFSARFTF